MIATVDIADVGFVRTLLRRRSLRDVEGLLWADIVAVVPLASKRPPRLRPAATLAFWDRQDQADAFGTEHPLGRRFADGYHVTLRPLRATGTWPGLPVDLPTSPAVSHDGEVMVLTLGRLRTTQIARFLRASRPAERAAGEADGFVWGTAMARPPVVATFSAWDGGAAAHAYAHGTDQAEHANAIAAQRRKDFHRESAFIRFAPVEVRGSLQEFQEVAHSR